MSGSILFIGTSFLGAIKQGYDSLFASDKSATFIGLIAPELVANMKSGWRVCDRRLHLSSEFSCFLSGGDQSVERDFGSRTFPGTAKVAGLVIDLRSFSKIVFVDMFYRLRPAFVINERQFPTLHGRPVSNTFLAESKINGLNGWYSLDRHPQYGQVPFVSAKPLMLAIKEATDTPSVSLIAAPRPPTGNINIDSKYGDLASARRSFDYLEQFYANELARHGIEYLAQPADVLDDDGCLTRLEFSRGEHPSKAGVADEHMNRHYGEAILAKYAKSIIGRV